MQAEKVMKRAGCKNYADGLRSLLKIQPVYAYNFEGRCYDVGDKEGFLEATVEYVLRRPELRDGFLVAYLSGIVKREK